MRGSRSPSVKVWSRLRSPRPSRAAGGYRLTQSGPCRERAETSAGHGEAAVATLSDDLELQLGAGSLTPAATNEEEHLLNGSTTTMFGGAGVPAAGRIAPRYRFRDLLMGDFAFNDDGER